MNTDTPPSNPPTEDKTVAFLSYLSIVGFIVGLVLHSSKKTRLGAFHLRQGLGLALTFMVLHVLVGFIPFGLFSYNLVVAIPQLLWLGYVVLVVLGLIAVSNGSEKPLPLVGERYQEWFKNTITA